LQNDNNIYVRGAAAESLGNLNDPQAIEPLVVGLSDKDGYVHEKTLKALETLSTSLAQPYNFAIALPQMEIILLHDQDDFTRADVIRTLIAFGLAGVEGVEELLITSMQTNQYDWIRANSLEALITSNTLSSLDVITDALFNDPAYEVKNTAADVIFATLGEDAVSIFSEALQQSTDDSAGLTLAGYLSNIGENATNPEKVTLAVNALLEALKNNPDDGVRRNSALSLGRIGQNLEDQALIDKIIAGLNAAKNDESQFVTEIIDKALSMVQ
jgi:HEAT repeat protein